MPDISTESEFHHPNSLEKLELLPDLTLEQLHQLHLSQLHPVVRRRIHQLQDQSPVERRRSIWNKGVLAFGPLVLPPEYLMAKDDDVEIEDVMISIGVRNTLANAIYIGGSADADPLFQQNLVSMLKFVYQFIEAHGNDPDARALRGWMNGLKAEVGIDKALEGPFSVYTPPFNTDYRPGYVLDAQKKIDRVLIPKTNHRTAFLPDIKGEFYIPFPYFRVTVKPDNVELDDQTRKALGQEEAAQLQEIARNGKILSLEIAISTDPKYLPELDLSLNDFGAILRNYAKPDSLIKNGIMRAMEKWIK